MAERFSVGQQAKVVSRGLPIPYGTTLPVMEIGSGQWPTVRLDYERRQVWLYLHEVETINQKGGR